MSSDRLPTFAYPDEDDVLDYPRPLGAVGGAAGVHILRDDEPGTLCRSDREVRLVEYSSRRRPVCVVCRRVAEREAER